MSIFEDNFKDLWHYVWQLLQQYLLLLYNLLLLQYLFLVWNWLLTNDLGTGMAKLWLLHHWLPIQARWSCLLLCYRNPKWNMLLLCMLWKIRLLLRHLLLKRLLRPALLGTFSETRRWRCCEGIYCGRTCWDRWTSGVISACSFGRVQMIMSSLSRTSCIRFIRFIRSFLTSFFLIWF